MGERTCGACRECCTWMTVAEIDKPRGQRCPHLSRLGCSIHSRACAECREFRCAWLRGSLEAEQRPDRVGVILSWVLDGAELHAAECRPGALVRGAWLLDGIRRAYGVTVTEHAIGG